MADGGNFFVLDRPLAPAPATLQTRSAHLKGFSTLVHDLGHSPARILDAYGIDRQAILSGDFYVDCQSLVRMIGQCGRDLGQPLFGVMLAKRQSTHILGALDALCRAAADFRSALDALCVYIPVAHSPQCKLEVLVGQATTELRISSRSEFEYLDQMIYGGLLTILTFLRELGGGEFVPTYVTTRYRPSARVLADLSGLLGCKVLPGQENDAIGFASGLLDKPLPSANRLTFTLLAEYLNRVNSGQRQSLIDRVDDYIRGALADRCSLRRCAAALGMNARALQIRLNALGLSFSDRVTEQRITLARAYVLSDELTLDDIAVRLGYAEQTSFGRAFRRWTGLTPGAFKASGGASADPTSTGQLSTKRV